MFSGFELPIYYELGEDHRILEIVALGTQWSDEQDIMRAPVLSLRRGGPTLYPCHCNLNGTDNWDTYHYFLVERIAA